MKYVVFTTKHHAGFCMWDTKTTDFNIMKTPYGKDITRELFDAFRAEGIRVGVYFSPDDFWMLHKQGHPITRTRPEANPKNNPELMQHNLAQVRELLTGYGKIDFIFFDGEPDQLKQLAWKLDPQILVTRGEMKTPEQNLPGKPLPGPWEANFTMGTEWPFKPTNEEYKSGTELIKMLLEVRAKGGNLLLNIGPDPDGVIPFEQTRRLRELALWLFVNGEAIYNIRPWIVTNEGSLWFTKAKDADTVYAFETNVPWEWATWREFTPQDRARQQGHRGGGRRPDRRKPLLVQRIVQGHLAAGRRRPAHPRHVRPATLHRLQMAEPHRHPHHACPAGPGSRPGYSGPQKSEQRLHRKKRNDPRRRHTYSATVASYDTPRSFTYGKARSAACPEAARCRSAAFSEAARCRFYGCWRPCGGCRCGHPLCRGRGGNSRRKAPRSISLRGDLRRYEYGPLSSADL